MTVTLNGPMEGKARFSGLPGGTALQGGGVGHYHCVVYVVNKELTSLWYKDIDIVTQTATYTTHTYYSKCIVHCCHPSCVGGSAGVVATVIPLDRGDDEEWSINSDGGARSDRRPVLPESDDLIWVTRNRSAVEDKHVI